MPLLSSFSHGAWHCHRCLCAKNYPQRLSHSSTGGLSQKFRSEHAACSSLLSLLNIEKIESLALKARLWLWGWGWAGGEEWRKEERAVCASQWV